LFWTGRLPPDRFVAPRGDGVFFDPHTHGSDPVDGAISLEALLARETARGVSVVAITNHDAPPPAVGGVPGMEWSGGIHPRQTFLHLLIYGGDGAIDDALTSRIPALGPDPGSAYGTALDVVARAKRRGAAVIVAHYPATKRRMERDGTVHHLPSPEDLVAAGVDGFEVANRRGPDDAEAMELLRHLDDLCREHGLLRLGSSDDHGMPAGSPCITFVPGTGTPGPTPRDDVLDRLGNRGALVPVIVRRARVPHGVPPILRGPLWAARYLLALSLWARVSWILWLLVAIRWVSRDGRPAKEAALSGSRGGCRGSGSASSPPR
jgi:hypothetical protein